MGRLQRKARKPQGKGIRTAYTFDQKVAMKRMKAKGYSFEKVKDELTLPKLAKSTFYHIVNTEFTDIPASHQFRRARSDVTYELNTRFEEKAVSNLAKEDGEEEEDDEQDAGDDEQAALTEWNVPELGQVKIIILTN